jgi:hypothetical protein
MRNGHIKGAVLLAGLLPGCPTTPTLSPQAERKPGAPLTADEVAFCQKHFGVGTNDFPTDEEKSMPLVKACLEWRARIETGTSDAKAARMRPVDAGALVRP